uniref:Uncharacterized protein n=1 Tax=Oryza punctata TaxID=4537 RepID=A0A0E0KFT3_ORYPU
MIREAQINELSAIVDRLMTTDCCLEPLVPTVRDFPFHLKPYAQDFIRTKLRVQEFDEYLASGKLDDVVVSFMSSKDNFVEFAVNEVVPSKFRALECSLIKSSFERRAEVVYMQTDICTYADCLLGLLVNEPGKASFSELVDKFNSELFSRNSLPKHYAIRGLIDCRTILLRKDISLDQAFEKFWKDTRYYRHQYYDIIRDPLRQVNWCPRTQHF